MEAGRSGRRTWLQGAGAGLVVACHHLLAPRHVRASDLALSDRIDLLYSNQFHFNERGEPQITVGLMQGQTRVRLSAPGGLVVLPSGDGGTTIEAGRTVEVTLGRAEPAEESYAVVVEELDGAAAQRPGPAMDRWAARGVAVQAEEVGTVFGVRGHVLDNRRTLLTTGRFGSERTAHEAAKHLQAEHKAAAKLHPRVSRRGRGSLTAVDVEHGVKVHAEGVLWFSPRGDGPITVHDVMSDTTMGPGTRGDRTYWGSIYVAIDRHGKLTVVNLASETELLSGLVPAEIFASAPMAALEAQAVAARGQLVSKVGTRHQADPFLLCSEQHCQVYAGRGREHPRTSKAVRNTVGCVAMRPGRTQLVDTVYSANCGGYTENNEHVWPGEPDPQLRGRPDPLLAERWAAGIPEGSVEAWLRSAPSAFSKPRGEAGHHSYRWAETVDPAAIAGREGVPAGLGRVREIAVLHRGRSGRATAVRLVGERSRFELRGELRIRRALGGHRSSLFFVDGLDRYGRFNLVGGGHGHGVGMCQHGAMGMAAAGKSFREILTHYYAGAELLELW